jgi:hypothetical protein
MNPAVPIGRRANLGGTTGSKQRPYAVMMASGPVFSVSPWATICLRHESGLNWMFNSCERGIALVVLYGSPP